MAAAKHTRHPIYPSFCLVVTRYWYFLQFQPKRIFHAVLPSYHPQPRTIYEDSKRDPDWALETVDDLTAAREFLDFELDLKRSDLLTPPNSVDIGPLLKPQPDDGASEISTLLLNDAQDENGTK